MRKRPLKNKRTLLIMLLISLGIIGQTLFVCADEPAEYQEETAEEYTDDVTPIEETTVYISPDEVKNEINALPTINAIRYSDSEQIKNIRAHYDALTDEDKALIDNLQTLEAAEQRVALLEELTNATYSFSYKLESDEETILKIVYAEAQPSIMMLSPAGEEYVILTDAMAKDDSKTISENNLELTITTVTGEDALLFKITRCEAGLWKINSSSPVSITTQEEETTTATPEIVDGWTVAGLQPDAIPEEILGLFQNSVSTDFTLTQYLGSKQNGSTEYGFLCSCNDGYRIIVLAVDTGGNASIIKTIAYTPEEGEDIASSASKMLAFIEQEQETTTEPETTSIPENEGEEVLSSEMITLVVIVVATTGLCIAAVLIIKKVLGKRAKKDKDKDEIKEDKETKKKEEKVSDKPVGEEKKEKPTPEKRESKKRAFVPRTEDIVQLTEEEELERIKRESDALYAKVGSITPKKKETPEQSDKSDSYYVVTQEDLDNDVTIEEYTVGDEDNTADPNVMSEGVKARRTFFPEDRFN